MPKLTMTTRFDAPVDEVFAALTDIPSWPDIVSGIEAIEMLTDGPVGLGTRFRETRIMFKREATEEMELIAWEPNRHYALEANSCGCRYLSTFDFESDGDATVLTQTFDARAVSFLAKLMSPIGRLMMGTMRRCLEKDMRDVKAAIEGRASEGATAPV